MFLVTMRVETRTICEPVYSVETFKSRAKRETRARSNALKKALRGAPWNDRTEATVVSVVEL